MEQNKTTFNISARELVAMLALRVSEIGGTRKSTYNKQDPTERIQSKCLVYFDIDPFLLHDYKYEPTEEDLREYPKEMFEQAPPPDALYELKIDNVTWGTEVTLTFKDSSIPDEVIQKHIETKRKPVLEKPIRTVINFYLDHSNGEICWEKDLEKVKDFLVFILCGGAKLCTSFKIRKNMTEEELKEEEDRLEAEQYDASILRNCH